MRTKLLALSLSILFFGSITTSAIASTVYASNGIEYVKKDDDKKKAKKASAEKSTEKSGECAAEKKECCSSAKGAEAKPACNDKK